MDSLSIALLDRHFFNHWVAPPDYSYCYKPIQKCASSTIKRTLWQVESKRSTITPLPNAVRMQALHQAGYPLHIPWLKLPNVLEKSSFLFTVVRNPYVRALSAYLDKIRNKSSFPIIKLFEHNYGKPPHKTSFIDFLNLLRDEHPSKHDPHWKSQAQICGVNALKYSYIGKVENLNESISDILELAGLPPIQIKSKAPHKTDSEHFLKKFYTDEAVELVNKIYAHDFHYFKYSFNDLDHLVGEKVEAPALTGYSPTLNNLLKIQKNISGNRIQQALRIIKLGMEHDWPYPMVIGSRILLYGARTEYQAVITAMTRALELQPNTLEFHFYLSDALAGNDQEADSKEELKRFNKLMPFPIPFETIRSDKNWKPKDSINGDIHRHLIAKKTIFVRNDTIASWPFEKNDIQKAKKELEKALAIEPHDSVARWYKSQILRMEGKGTEAKQELIAVAHCGETSSEFFRHLAARLEINDDIPGAIKALKHAVKQNPTDSANKIALRDLVRRASLPPGPPKTSQSKDQDKHE